MEELLRIVTHPRCTDRIHGRKDRDRLGHKIPSLKHHSPAILRMVIERKMRVKRTGGRLRQMIDAGLDIDSRGIWKAQRRSPIAVGASVEHVTQGLKTCHLSFLAFFTELCSTLHLLQNTFNGIKIS